MLESIKSRIDGVTHIPKEYLGTKIPCPPSIKVELVNSCNLKCAGCGINGRQEAGREVIDLGLFDRIIREFVENGGYEVGLFFIGESTVKPDVLLKALRICKRNGVKYTFLTSNFTLLNPMLAGELMEEGLDSLKASINFDTSESFADGTGVKGKLWDRALNNLKAAYEVRAAHNYKTRLYASSIKFSDEQQAKMASLLAKRVIPYCDEHYWLPFFSEMQSPLAEENIKRGWKANAGNQGRLGNLRPPVPCWSVFREAHLALRKINGETRHVLSLCCFGATDDWDAGVLDGSTFMDVWNGQTAQWLRDKHLGGDLHGTPCESCIHGTQEIAFV